MQLEKDACGLRRCRTVRDCGPSMGSGLRHDGEAGPFWSLLMHFLGLQIARAGRRRPVTVAQRYATAREAAIDSAGAKSIQKVVPTPTSLSNPI